MKKGIKPGAAILLGLLSLAVPGWGFAQGSWEGDYRGRGRDAMGWRFTAILDNEQIRAALNLADPQVDRLRQILVETRKSAVKSRAEMAVRRIELRELLRADTPDREAVMKKVQEISSLRAELMKQHVEALLAAKSVLTPEQQKKFRTYMERWRGAGRWRGRLGRFRPGASERPERPPAPRRDPDEPPVE
jgi:Spy/CpxP family protein refolding chaperone